jgi:prepilin-type N-terminal cleavage/methylation domain-containing protein
MRFTSQSNRGFTLIELLVVIAIIGVLASVVLSSMNQARMKGRDARRHADLKQFQVALEMYRTANRAYPIVNCYPQAGPNGQGDIDGWAGEYQDATWNYTPCQTSLQTALAPYIRSLPTDPIGTDSTGYDYWYGSVRNGTGYILLTYFEASNNLGLGCFPGYYCIGMSWQ